MRMHVCERGWVVMYQPIWCLSRPNGGPLRPSEPNQLPTVVTNVSTDVRPHAWAHEQRAKMEPHHSSRHSHHQSEPTDGRAREHTCVEKPTHAGEAVTCTCSSHSSQRRPCAAAQRVPYQGVHSVHSALDALDVQRLACRQNLALPIGREVEILDVNGRPPRWPRLSGRRWPW